MFDDFAIVISTIVIRTILRLIHGNR